jgi:KamA family protein
MQINQKTQYRSLNFERFLNTVYWDKLGPELQHSLRVVSAALPFRVNEYVLTELVDWENLPVDPIFQLTFPQRAMLAPEDFEIIEKLVDSGTGRGEIAAAANGIRRRMNPHPAGQVDHNVPVHNGKRLEGIQHKYGETLLYFPGQARTCHAYCTFCFRWALVADGTEHAFANPKVEDMLSYLSDHPEITDVLFTGGDPMIMGAKVLARHIEPLLEPRFEHVQNIRIGTKSIAYWPHRYVTDADAGDILRLFEKIVDSRRHLAIMAHFNHPIELSTPLARKAVRSIRSTGAQIRAQAPVVKRVNDDPNTWARLWRRCVRVGVIPYYMFVERDTGPKEYFELPLVRAVEIYRRAIRQVSGLARTARGPVMSAFFGKVRIAGESEVRGQKVLALEYLQARDPSYVGKPFFARYDPEATWFDQLEPAFEADERFFVSQSDYDGEEALCVSA